MFACFKRLSYVILHIDLRETSFYYALQKCMVKMTINGFNLNWFYLRIKRTSSRERTPFHCVYKQEPVFINSSLPLPSLLSGWPTTAASRRHERHFVFDCWTETSLLRQTDITGLSFGRICYPNRAREGRSGWNGFAVRGRQVRQKHWCRLCIGSYFTAVICDS